jgi:ferric-dicitrate binding protein FerR (iron transport regulator)
MKDKSTYYIDLITRYFSGEISEVDLRVLSDWLKNDTENENLFRQYHKTWLLLESQKVSASIELDNEWMELQSKLELAKTKADPDKVVALKIEKHNRNYFTFTAWRAAAAVILVLISTFVLYFYISKPDEIVVMAQTENIEQLLPDGSLVSLHAGSQLTYPEKFTSGTRNVKLQGEAYFKVAHDKTKPFIVSANDVRVEVLGTQFNVNTHTSTGAMEVVLTTGKVSVYYAEKPQAKVLLLPGEKAELHGNHSEISKTTNSDLNYMAWKTRILVFDNETLEQVVSTLQNVYQKPVSLADKQLADCRVTASFNNQSLESVLEVIKETLGLTVMQDANSIIISGNACK